MRLAACVPLLLLAGPALAAAPGHAVAARHAAADWQLSGKVTSPKGEGLPGVTVVVKGTTLGTTSNPDGTFSLSVPETPGTLVFSFIGFQTQERAFSGPGTFTVALADDSKSLDEVVVVGYGTQKKADVSGAIATFDATKLEERPIARVDQALVGQLAGVQVKQTTGVPGRAFSIQVRGAGSISAGNEPLYVIDGFPLDNASQNGSGRFASGSPLDNINPNDIENITVLKDAAAAAIYGSRAANGVVLITTKKGRSGKPQIAFNTYFGINQAAKKLDLLSAEEWTQRAAEIINAKWVASGPGRTASQSTADRLKLTNRTTIDNTLMIDERWFQPGHPGLQYVDWQDEAFRTGKTQNYQVSASGNTDNVNYYVSGNYTDQQGFVYGLGYKRYSARANVEIKANKKLRFGLNVTPTYSVANDPGIEGKDNLLHQLVSETPVVEDSVGTNTNFGRFDGYRWGVSTSSPLARIKANVGETKTFRTLSTVYGEYEIIPGLRARSSINFDNNDVTSKSYAPATRTVVYGTATLPQASGSYSGFRRQTFVNENTLTYSRTLGGQHNFTVLGGYSYNYSRIDNVRLSASGGFVSSGITTLNAATNITGTGSNNTTESENLLLSYFGRLQYDYAGKYLLSASIRRDGSSRFGPQRRFGVFPAASAAWRISQEGFLDGASDFLSDLKLRASVGFSGNNSIGDYSSISTLGIYNYSFGGALATGQAPNRPPNDVLGWEKNRTIDFGFDLGLFKNRIYLSGDYYTKNSQDLLLNVPVLSGSGFGNYLKNIGEVVNKGVELELTTRNLISANGGFEWTTTANGSYNENKVVHLGPGDAQIEVTSIADTPSNILRVGLPIYSIYVVKQIGILTQADIDNKVAQYNFPTQTAGDPKYEDINNDGKIDVNDRQVVGQPNPKFTWGITNTFKYKGFDLSFLVQGQNGGYIYSLLGRAIDRTSVGYQENALGRSRDRWMSPENPGAGIKGKAATGFGAIKNTDWLYSSDYYRVRNITLGYDLGRVISKGIAQGARVYVTAENFFGHDKYYGGYNPDAVNTDNGSTFTSGVDYGGLPLAKSLIFGLNLTF
jgi:TonB-linked SusC/RagA family outer membrane protein